MTAVDRVVPEMGAVRNPNSTYQTPDRFLALTRAERCDIADTHERLAVAAGTAGAWARCGFHVRAARAVWAGAAA